MDSNAMTSDEFVGHFQTVIKYVKEHKEMNEREWSLIRSAFSMLADKHTELINSKFSEAHKEHSAKLQKALKEQDLGMKAVYDRAAKLPEKGDKGDPGKDGRDGRDGKDAEVDEEKIVKSVIEKIPKPKDGKDGRTGHSSAAPHPMRVYDLSTKTDGTTKIFTVPKSVSGIIHMSDFPYVLCEGNGYTINAARTQITLTVTNAPTAGSQLIYQYASMFNLLT